jgi:hypothetical protein
MHFSKNLKGANEHPSTYEDPLAQRVRELVDGNGRVGGESIEQVEAEMKRRRQSGHYASAAIGNLPTVFGGSKRGDEAAPSASAQTRTDSDASIFERLAQERLERGRALMRTDATRTDGPTESLSQRLQRENDDRARSAWLGSSDDADES